MTGELPPPPDHRPFFLCLLKKGLEPEQHELMPELYCVEIPYRARRVIGRASRRQADIPVVVCRLINTRHAQISNDEDGWSILDLKSLNGTFVNGRRVSSEAPTIIHTGDEIRLANLLFVVRDLPLEPQPVS